MDLENRIEKEFHKYLKLTGMDKSILDPAQYVTMKDTFMAAIIILLDIQMQEISAIEDEAEAAMALETLHREVRDYFIKRIRI